MFSPRGFTNRFGRAGKCNGSYMEILRRRVYRGWVCHVSVTSIIGSKFYITRPIKLRVRNAKPKTFWIWLPCHLLGKLVTQPGGKLMKVPIECICCILERPVCSDIQHAWKIICSNFDLMRYQIITNWFTDF